MASRPRMFGYTFMRTLSTVARLASIVMVAFVLAGLLGFLTDEVRDSSKVSSTRISQVQGNQQVVVVDITQPDPPANVERLREQRHTKAREVIDDVGDVLFRPFSWIGRHRAVWVQRLIDSGLALLLYGVVLMVLADRLRRLADQSRRDAISAAEQKAADERRASGTFASPA